MSRFIQYRDTPAGKGDELYLTGLELNEEQFSIAQSVIGPYRSFIRLGNAPGNRPVAKLVNADSYKPTEPGVKLYFPTSPVDAGSLAGWFGQITIAMTAAKYFAKNGQVSFHDIKISDVPDELVEAYGERSLEKPDKAIFFDLITGRADRATFSRYRLTLIAKYPLDAILRVLQGARLSILHSA